MIDTRTECKVLINGVEHTMLLSPEDKAEYERRGALAPAKTTRK